MALVLVMTLLVSQLIIGFNVSSTTLALQTWRCSAMMKWLLEDENGVDIRMYMLTFLAYVGCLCKFESVGVKRVHGTENVTGGNNFLDALSGHMSV